MIVALLVYLCLGAIFAGFFFETRELYSTRWSDPATVGKARNLALPLFFVVALWPLYAVIRAARCFRETDSQQ